MERIKVRKKEGSSKEYLSAKVSHSYQEVSDSAFKSHGKCLKSDAENNLQEISAPSLHAKDEGEKTNISDDSSSDNGASKLISDTGERERNVEKSSMMQAGITHEDESEGSYSGLPKSLSSLEKPQTESPNVNGILSSKDSTLQEEETRHKKTKIEANLEKFKKIMSTYERPDFSFEDCHTLDTHIKRIYSCDDLSQAFDYTPLINLSEEFDGKLKISSKSAPATFFVCPKISDTEVLFSEENVKKPELLAARKSESSSVIAKENSIEISEEKKQDNEGDSKRTLTEYDKIDLTNINESGNEAQNIRTTTIRKLTFDIGYPVNPTTRSRASSENAEILGSSGIKRRPKSLEIPSSSQYKCFNVASDHITASSESAKRPNKFSFAPRKNYYMFFPSKSGILKRCSSLSDLYAFRNKQLRRTSTLRNYHRRALNRHSTATSETKDSRKIVSQISPSVAISYTDEEKVTTNSETLCLDQDQLSEQRSKTDPVGRWGPLQSTSRSPTYISVIPQKKVARKLFCPPRCSALTKLLQGNVPYRGEQDLAIDFDRLIVADRLPPSAIELIRNAGAGPCKEDAARSTSVIPKRKSVDSDISVQPAEKETEIKKIRISPEGKSKYPMLAAILSERPDTEEVPAASDTGKDCDLHDSSSTNLNLSKVTKTPRKISSTFGGKLSTKKQQKRGYVAKESSEVIKSADATAEKQGHVQVKNIDNSCQTANIFTKSSNSDEIESLKKGESSLLERFPHQSVQNLATDKRKKDNA